MKQKRRNLSNIIEENSQVSSKGLNTLINPEVRSNKKVSENQKELLREAFYEGANLFYNSHEGIYEIEEDEYVKKRFEEWYKTIKK